MTVAPELPPVLVARRAELRRRVRATGRTPSAARLARVATVRASSARTPASARMPVSARTPAEVLALVEPRRPLTLVPEPELQPDIAPEPGTGRVHRPAGPVPLHPAGARVVRPAGGRLRLTRRGRLAATAAILLIAVLAVVGVTSRVGSLSGPPVPASAPTQVVVAPGETLWSIAERVAPQRDPRTVVDSIRELNQLPGTDVRAGQTLLLRAP
jgi:hypothetical protein